MTNQHRRRIDDVLDPGFVDGLDALSPRELREKLRDARTEESSLSYVRRNLHGHLDLLRAELDLRRGGRGTTSDVEALAAALSGPASATRGVRSELGLRAAKVTGRRGAEKVLVEDHLARLPDMSDEEIEEVTSRVADSERDLSDDRQRLHSVIDVLEAELARRYKEGLELSLDRLQ
jgi:hypothetical protein